MSKLWSLVVTLVWLMPTAGFSEDLNYDFLDLGYSHAILSNTMNGHGYQIDGNYDVSNGFFLQGAYSHQSFDYAVVPPFASSETYSDYRLGAGWHYTLNKSIDFIAHLSYGHDAMKFESSTPPLPSANGSSSGYIAGVGIRTALTSNLEFEANFEHSSLGIVNTVYPAPPKCPTCITLITSQAPDMAGNTLSGTFRYNVTDHFALGLEYDHGNSYGESRWLLAGRWYY